VYELGLRLFELGIHAAEFLVGMYDLSRIAQGQKDLRLLPADGSFVLMNLLVEVALRAGGEFLGKVPLNLPSAESPRDKPANTSTIGSAVGPLTPRFGGGATDA
jgi:hypothetical protein